MDVAPGPREQKGTGQSKVKSGDGLMGELALLHLHGRSPRRAQAIRRPAEIPIQATVHFSLTN